MTNLKWDFLPLDKHTWQDYDQKWLAFIIRQTHMTRLQQKMTSFNAKLLVKLLVRGGKSHPLDKSRDNNDSWHRQNALLVRGGKSHPDISKEREP